MISVVPPQPSGGRRHRAAIVLAVALGLALAVVGVLADVPGWFIAAQLTIGGGLLALATSALRRADRERARSESWRSRLGGRERALVEELRQAEQLKTELIAMVSHEFRTPLTAILGFSQTLTEHLRALDYDTALACARRIGQQAHRLSRLVHNLLAASGDVECRPAEATDLSELAPAVADDVARLHPGARVAVDIERGLSVAVDPLSTTRVLENLLSNGAKFGRPDGTVQLRAWREHEDTILEVANAGGPLGPDVRSRMFDRFWQADSSDTREHEGIGLGLYVVSRIVAAHGGTISVRDEPDRVVFAVALPSVPAGRAGSAGAELTVDLEAVI